jgi:hypothetical protein
MRSVSIIALSLIAAMLPASAQDPVPYAYRPPATGDTYVPLSATFLRPLHSPTNHSSLTVGDA